MATLFSEPGGDADFAVTATNGFWSGVTAAPSVVSDFVHGGHVRSIKYRAANQDLVSTATGTLITTGSRFSLYLYLVALPDATADLVVGATSGASRRVSVRITSAGVLQLWNANTAQIGTDGATLATGIWYRISLAFIITDTTHNRFELFVDGVSSISVTNGTLSAVTISKLIIGNFNINATLDFRTSDHYIDDSSALTDTGNIWVTAKRPNANGTANNFNVQIGAGGSGYGSGHSPQVNERPLSTTNGWSVINAGSVITEEYNIENTSTGDIDISTVTIVDYIGWVSASSVTSETASIIVNNATSNISLTNSAALFTKIAGSSTYPAGTGTDIGVVTDTTITTVGLYECGIVVAYIPINNLSISTSDSTVVSDTSTISAPIPPANSVNMSPLTVNSCVPGLKII